MGFRFVVVETTASSHHDGTLGTLERTHPPTLGTGPFLAQLIGLLESSRFQGAGQQRPHGHHRHLLHLIEIDIQPRALLAPMPPHDDFSPLLGQSHNSLDIL